VIIISVEEVQYQSDKDPGVAHRRWEREAVDASVKQIYGAQRWLANATRLVRKDGSHGLRLPPPDTRRVYRIAVAIGGKGEQGQRTLSLFASKEWGDSNHRCIISVICAS
jgi:hypothetical protein